jgi:hypothetical protein
MIDWDGAIRFVWERGTPLDRLRLRRALGNSCSPDEAEDVLAAHQFPDGSWHHSYDMSGNCDRVGSLGGTIHCLRWLREFELTMVHRWPAP